MARHPSHAAAQDVNILRDARQRADAQRAWTSAVMSLTDALASPNSIAVFSS